MTLGTRMRTTWGAAVLLNALPLFGQSAINPAKLQKLGSIEERYQSFNIEMVEVTGGRFWKPYGGTGSANEPAGEAGSPAGVSPSLFEYRPPADLSSTRLRKLAAALGPAYVRISGTWANSSYFQNTDDAAPAKPPKGFNATLTRQEWKGAVDFAHAVDAKIITSFATSAGTRDANGVWTPDQGAQFVTYTKSIGGEIAAAEFMNEPNFAEMGGAPKGYSAADYGKDLAVFVPWARAAAPGMKILGPGSVGEGISLGEMPGMHFLKSQDLLASSDAKALDAISYHFYGAVSKRCGGTGLAATTSAEAALTEDFLGRTAVTEQFYSGLRDRFAPGKPMWLTETGEAACGGDPWASTFIDSFRYLNQLGRLAQLGVQVVAHNTLAASDYALLDDKTLTPRPNYWAALLWRKFMGITVLNPGPPSKPELHIYAHCLRNVPGGVALLAINTSRNHPAGLKIGAAGERYTLTAKELQDRKVQLNGASLELGSDDSLPKIESVAAKSGQASFPPASITFIAIAEANNKSCR